jgi:hypothetical protein
MDSDAHGQVFKQIAQDIYHSLLIGEIELIDPPIKIAHALKSLRQKPLPTPRHTSLPLFFDRLLLEIEGD